MKAFATGVLLLNAALYVFALNYETQIPQLIWLKVFSEAALVGGLADWFAVTALFRHPLGLPIPHTAIIPRGKERIGVNLGQFIQTNFLTVETVGRKLASYDFGHKLSGWLLSRGIANRIASRLVLILPRCIDALDAAEVQRLMDGNIRALVQSVKAAPFAGRALTFLLSGSKFDIALAGVLDFLDVVLRENKEAVKDALRDEIPWYVPGFMHNKVFERVSTNLRDVIFDIRADPYHPLRAHIRAQTEQFIERLLHSQDYLVRGEQLKETLLASELPPEYLQHLWTEIKTSINDDLSREASSQIQAGLTHAIATFGATLSRDEELQRKINRALVTVAGSAITVYSNDVRGFVAETVAKWDEKTITEKIELHVGKDLQYIRLNGTLVGGLVGLLIHFLSTLR